MSIRSIAIRGASAVALALAALSSQGALAAPDSAPQVAETATGRIPVAEFVKSANMRNPRISPDGKRLAYLAASSGREVLVMMDLTDLSKPAKLILAAEEARESGERSLANFRWIGNDHIVMTILMREDLGAGPGDFGRLVAYDVTSGELIEQAWRDAGADASNILHIDHETGKYLLERDSVANSTERWGLPEVVEVNVADGRFEIVQRTNPVVRGWAADSNGVVRAGFNQDRDNGKVRMMYRSDADETFHTVYNEADATFTESVPAPRMFIPGTDTAYVVSRKDGYERVYKLDMETMTMSDPLFQTPGFDIQGLITNDDGSKLLGYRTFDGEMKSVYTEPVFKTIQGFLDEMFGPNVAQIADWSQDRGTFLIYAGGKERAGGYYLYDTESGSMKLLNWTRAALKDAPLNPVEAVWYTASDGTKLQAIVTYPRHRLGQKNLPVVVMPHGGPFGVKSATNSTEPWNQPLAEAGYVVIQPNYRGSGGYGKEFEMLGREPGGYGVRMQDDLNDALSHFAQLGLVDEDRACIMGWSYGGYAAARGAQRDPDVWQCAIAGAGVYDMPLMNRWDAANLGKFNRGFQATSDNPEGISSARHTDGEWAPILIVAAKRDARIPMEQAETLVGNLRDSGKQEGVDFRYIVQEQGTHNLPYDDVHIQWIEEAEKWLQKHNPAYIASDPDKAPPLIDFD